VVEALPKSPRPVSV